MNATRAMWLGSSAATIAGLSLRGAGMPLGAAAQAAAVHLRCGVGTVEANAQAFYAADMGYFKKNGLDVDIVKLRSGTTTMAAIVAGDLQCGVANVLSLGVARQRGIPLVLIAPGAYYDSTVATTQVVVAPNSPLTTAKDLNGKTVGGISLGGLDQLAMDAYIDRGGGDLSTVKFVEVPPSLMAEALAQGRVSAVAMNDPELSHAIEANQVKVLSKGYDAISKLFMQTVWFSTQDWLNANKETAKRFGDAIAAGGKWGMANSEAAAGVLAKYTNFKEARAKMRYADRLDPALIQPVFDAALKYKLLPGPLAAADMVWNGK